MRQLRGYLSWFGMVCVSESRALTSVWRSSMLSSLLSIDGFMHVAASQSLS